MIQNCWLNFGLKKFNLLLQSANKFALSIKRVIMPLGKTKQRSSASKSFAIETKTKENTS